MSFCCTECWTVHKLGELTSWTCNETSCNGSVVYIDDLIQKAVVSLNINGIKTMFSCSGHVDTRFEQNNPYVMFSLNDCVPFDYDDLLETLKVEDEHVIFDGDNFNYIVQRLSENSNIDNVLNHFQNDDIDTELSYFKPQNLFRVVLRLTKYKDGGTNSLYLAKDDALEYSKWIKNNNCFTQSVLTMPPLEIRNG